MSLVLLAEELAAKPDHPVLLTRLSGAQFTAFPGHLAARLDYHALSRMKRGARWNSRALPRR